MRHPTSILCAIFVFPAMAFCEVPAKHPFYVHARSDLSKAHLLLRFPDAPEVTRELEAAAERIQKAIWLIDNASVIDREHMDEHPRVETPSERSGRFTAIYQLLATAKQDLSQAEDNLSAVGWRNSAVDHVSQAIDLVKKADQDDWRKGIVLVSEHPHYSEAISELLFARTLVGPCAEAIHRIDNAISETKQAARDDGTNLKEQSVVAQSSHAADRYTAAEDALSSALRDLQFEEENSAALGWRTAAIRDVQDAIELTRQAERSGASGRTASPCPPTPAAKSN